VAQPAAQAATAANDPDPAETLATEAATAVATSKETVAGYEAEATAPSAVSDTTAVPPDLTGMAAQVAGAAQQIVQALQSLGLNAATSTAKDSAPSAAASDAAAAATTSATPAVSGGVVTLALDPEHLGRVSITLRMRADTVDIKIEVERPQTLALLEKDKHLLTAAVDAAGRNGAVDLTPGVAGGKADPAATASIAAETQADQGRNSLDSAPGQSRRQDDRETRTPLQDQVNDDDQAAASRSAPVRSDGGLYL
jgi:hypothetical protein